MFFYMNGSGNGILIIRKIAFGYRSHNGSTQAVGFVVFFRFVDRSGHEIEILQYIVKIYS